MVNLKLRGLCRIMEGASVSFEDWCWNNRDDFWRSCHNKLVALSDVSLPIFRKIVYLMEDCHDMDVCSGNLLERIRIVNNQDVQLLYVSPSICDDPIANTVQDLKYFKNLVTYAVSLTTDPNSATPEPVRCFYELFDLLGQFCDNLADLWNFEFFVRNCPLFLDRTGKYLMFRKILSLWELDHVAFPVDFPMPSIDQWMPWVRRPELIDVRDFENNRDHGWWMLRGSSVKFYRYCLGHVRENAAGRRYWSDAQIIDILEDDMPMVMPEWFFALVKNRGLIPRYCLLSLVDFLRGHTTVFE